MKYQVPDNLGWVKMYFKHAMTPPPQKKKNYHNTWNKSGYMK
jgi:hypothetical protein